MICKDCSYYWKSDDDRFPRCHYEGPEEWAPCEQEDECIEEYDSDDYLTEEEDIDEDLE